MSDPDYRKRLATLEEKMFNANSAINIDGLLVSYFLERIIYCYYLKSNQSVC